MRIAFFTSHINYSKQWLWFSEELKSAGIYHVHISSEVKKPGLLDELESIGIPTYFLPHKNGSSLLKNIFTARKILKKEKIDVVHSELPYGNIIGMSSALLAGISCRITTSENTTWPFDFNNKKQYYIDKAVFLLAKKIVALTEHNSKFIHEKYFVPENKISVIHHSLKVSEYENISQERIQSLRNETGISDQTFNIGLIGRFEFWKGHRYVIEAIDLLKHKYPQIRLYIFGSKGESFNETEQLIKEKSLEEYVYYKGFVKDNVALFRLFDIHIHVPTGLMAETFGINIIEGMISGCAQILTLSGISAFTANENNALIVDYKSAEQIAGAIEKLFLDKKLRETLGSNAKLNALELFNYKKKVDEHLKLYKETCQK